MSWVALVEILFALFGPIIAEWLKNLAAKQGPKLGTFPPTTSEAIGQWFAGLRSRVKWYEFGKKAKLAVLERVAARNAKAIYSAMVEGTRPTLSKADAAEVAAVI